MLISTVLLCMAAPALPQHDEPPAAKAAPTWYQGSWEELLAEARKSDRVVFLDFWADW